MRAGGQPAAFAGVALLFELGPAGGGDVEREREGERWRNELFGGEGEGEEVVRKQRRARGEGK